MSQQWSPDGSFWWDGTAWRQASPDRRQYYDGSAWQLVPATPAAPVYSPPPGQPGAAPPAVAGYAPPAYGPMPPPGMPVGAAVGFSLGHQFGGAALWSIGFGLVAIVVPLFTAFYFPILPIFGFINAVRAIRNGRLAGGIIGIVLNVLGGLVSLLASGLIGG